MSIQIEAACASHIGYVRSNNEDNFYFLGQSLPQENQGQNPPLYHFGPVSDGACLAVFDGMGGGDYGEAASCTAANRMQQLLMQRRAPEDVTGFLETACQEINRAVWNRANDLETDRMGSTLAALYFCGDSLHAINVGDSRIFGLRGERFKQISVDHTDEAYLREKGIIGRNPRLTQYIGMDPGSVMIEPTVGRMSLRAGDVYLICSDGLTDMVKQEEIQVILSSCGAAPACVEKLIQTALEHGGRDNVTVIVCRIVETAPAAAPVHPVEKKKEPLDQMSSLGRKLLKLFRD